MPWPAAVNLPCAFYFSEDHWVAQIWISLSICIVRLAFSYVYKPFHLCTVWSTATLTIYFWFLAGRPFMSATTVLHATRYLADGACVCSLLLLVGLIALSLLSVRPVTGHRHNTHGYDIHTWRCVTDVPSNFMPNVAINLILTLRSICRICAARILVGLPY